MCDDDDDDVLEVSNLAHQPSKYYNLHRCCHYFFRFQGNSFYKQHPVWKSGQHVTKTCTGVGFEGNNK